MTKGLVFYLRSAACTAWFRMHGIRSSLVACDGHLPALDTRGTVRIGKRFVVRGRVACVEIAAKPQAQILIGDRVFLNQGAVIAARESIEIGDDTLIGDFSAIYDSNYHQLEPGLVDKPRPVTIGKNVWLERRARAAGQRDRRPHGGRRPVGRPGHSPAARPRRWQSRQGHQGA